MQVHHQSGLLGAYLNSKEALLAVSTACSRPQLPARLSTHMSECFAIFFSGTVVVYGVQVSCTLAESPHYIAAFAHSLLLLIIRRSELVSRCLSLILPLYTTPVVLTVARPSGPKLCHAQLYAHEAERGGPAVAHLCLCVSMHASHY